MTYTESSRGDSHELVAEWVKEIAEMRRHLKIFVNEVLFKGEQLHQNTNRRYFPKKSDLRSHMFQATVKYRLSKINRMNVQMQVNDDLNAHKKDSFFFRPHIQDENEMKDANASSPCNEEEDDNHVDEEVLLTDESGEVKSYYFCIKQHGKNVYSIAMATIFVS